MRVLFLSPLGNTRCGERLYGEIWVQELRKVGVDVVEWDGFYPSAKERGYLPPDASSFNLIHVNWGPANMGHYLPEHFPSDVPLSVFLHDVPPNSTCLLWDRANLRIAHEPGEGIQQIDHAIPTYEGPTYTGSRDWPIRVGATGIRNDPGIGMVQELCRQKGWEFSGPAPEFLSIQDEIHRLAQNTFNICWYQTTGRGKSMGAMFCLAARRPLLVSSSSMFSALWPYRMEGELVMAMESTAYSLWYNASQMALMEWNPTYSVNGWVNGELAWPKCAERIKALWEGITK